MAANVAVHLEANIINIWAVLWKYRNLVLVDPSIGEFMGRPPSFSGGGGKTVWNLENVCKIGGKLGCQIRKLLSFWGCTRLPFCGGFAPKSTQELPPRLRWGPGPWLCEFSPGFATVARWCGVEVPDAGSRTSRQWPVPWIGLRTAVNQVHCGTECSEADSAPAAAKSALATLCTSTGLEPEKHALFHSTCDTSSQPFTDTRYVHVSVLLLTVYFRAGSDF